MEYKEFTVTYRLNEPAMDRLNKITKTWRSTGRETTPEELFDFIMTVGSVHDIEDKFDFIEKSLERMGTK